MKFICIFALETIAYYLWEMKRLLVLLVATLGYFCAYSQEANEGGLVPDFIVTPRFDANPYIPMNDWGHEGFDFGNSSIYTFLDGSIGNFSYSMCNHWVAEDTASLYKNAFRSDENDFIDWLTLSYTVGRFTFTVGKDVLAIGGSELDYNDVDVHYATASPFWHKVPFYQWGASIDFTNKKEDTNLRLQFASSPFGARPFASKLFSYSFQWTGEYGCYEPFWSVNFIEYERGRFVNIVALGNRFTIGGFSIELDYMNRATSFKRFFEQEWSVAAQLAYNFRDKVEVFARGGYDASITGDIFGYDDAWFIPTDNTFCPKYWYAGGGIHYFPLRKSRDLRIHAVAAYNNYAQSVSLTFGATYHFNLTKTILKKRR